MSALTKIAVILLVIASLLLSAGVVVFVNKVEDFRTTSVNAEEALKREQRGHGDMRNQYALATQSLLDQAKDFNTRMEAVKKESSDKDVQIGTLKGQIATLDQDKKNVEVAMTNLTKVQEGLQGQLVAAQQQVTDLRQIRDKLVEERHGLNVQLTDAVSKVEALNRAYKNAEERLQGARASLEDLERKVVAAGLTVNTLPNRINAAPQLEGVVSGVFTAGGKPWASVSLGSKDMVEKGMKFNVVNNQEFLGYLVIQTTEPNEAAGVLEGPKVQKVRQGDLVKTQLQ